MKKAALVPLLIEKFRRIMNVETELSNTVNKILGPVYMEVGDPRPLLKYTLQKLNTTLTLETMGVH